MVSKYCFLTLALPLLFCFLSNIIEVEWPTKCHKVNTVKDNVNVYLQKYLRKHVSQESFNFYRHVISTRRIYRVANRIINYLSSYWEKTFTVKDPKNVMPSETDETLEDID
ncbi:hypothetical protein SNEBB_006507, partial [Seison nebaliae]